MANTMSHTNYVATNINEVATNINEVATNINNSHEVHTVVLDIAPLPGLPQRGFWKSVMLRSRYSNKAVNHSNKAVMVFKTAA